MIERVAETGALLTDVEELRQRARGHMRGTAAHGAQADRTIVLALLNTSLATKLVCALWYRRHYVVATGIHEEFVAAEFLGLAAKEQAHADRIAHRISQLGGSPDFNPKGLKTKSRRDADGRSDLVDMIIEDLVAERISTQSSGEIIRYLGEYDPTTRRMLEEILAAEEVHAEGLHALIPRTS